LPPLIPRYPSYRPSCNRKRISAKKIQHYLHLTKFLEISRFLEPISCSPVSTMTKKNSKRFSQFPFYFLTTSKKNSKLRNGLLT
jgi:hypothetical protein